MPSQEAVEDGTILSIVDADDLVGLEDRADARKRRSEQAVRKTPPGTALGFRSAWLSGGGLQALFKQQDLATKDEELQRGTKLWVDGHGEVSLCVYVHRSPAD